MRNKFRELPVRQKLIVLTMAITAAALLLSGVGIVLSDSLLFRGYLRRDLSALARIIADNSTAALAFEDPRSAYETLGALRARTHLISACIYRADGTVLARYSRPEKGAGCAPVNLQDDIRFTNMDVTAWRPIMLNDRRIGTLALLYDLGEIDERQRLYGGAVLSVLLASSLIAFLLSSRLSAVIATPISELAHAAKSVSETRDYSIRAPKFPGDELGVLVDAFNEMLARIQSRDNELREALLAREEALREAQNARDFLRTTLASIGDAVISTDVGGRVVFANRVAQTLLRSREAEIAGKHLDEVFRVVNESSGARMDSPLLKVLTEGEAIAPAGDAVLIAQDGTETPIDQSGAPIRGDSGAIQGTVLVFRDDSARRRAEETRRLLASIVESSDDAILGMDLNGVVTSWNKGAERIFGFLAEEIIGARTAMIAAPDSDYEMPRVLERIKVGDRVEQFLGVRRTKRGEVIHVSITVSPLYDALGRIVGASEIARDITEQVRAAGRLAQLNADLQWSNENLARSNEDLERFAFVASHDLQEPLRMITVYSQLLVKTYPRGLETQAEAFIGNIVAGTKRMRELLADLLAYTEIGARPEEPVQTVDLNVVVQKAIENLKASIDDSGAAIRVAPLPTVSAYEGHLIPLFQNLIGNAIKYRGEEQPRIHISVEDQGGQLRFSVADNGMGIAPEYHEKIFGAFKRLHGNKIPGTGIGLAICQRVVERYGGRIWVESELGRGATFLFTLPGIAIRERRIG